jgi:hypothetical protein
LLLKSLQKVLLLLLKLLLLLLLLDLDDFIRGVAARGLFCGICYFSTLHLHPLLSPVGDGLWCTGPAAGRHSCLSKDARRGL